MQVVIKNIPIVKSNVLLMFTPQTRIKNMERLVLREKKGTLT